MALFGHRQNPYELPLNVSLPALNLNSAFTPSSGIVVATWIEKGGLAMPASFQQNESLIRGILERLNALDVELTPNRLAGIDGMNTVELLRLYWVLRRASRYTGTTCLVQALTESQFSKLD